MINKQKIPLKKATRILLGDIIYEKKKRERAVSKNGIRVLVYHSITDSLIKKEWKENTTPKDLFDKQLKYLKDNGYTAVSLEKAFLYLNNKEIIPDKTVAITFDDGFRNNYINALPILEKYKFPATIFITVDFLRDYSGSDLYLSCSEIKNMIKSGLISFGSHGLTHRALTTVKKRELDKEISLSKERLENIINNKTNFFAYPFVHSGSYNSNIRQLLKRHGFKAAFTTIFGINNFESNHFLLRRNRISWLDDLREFEKHLLGAYDWCAMCESFRYKKY